MMHSMACNEHPADRLCDAIERVGAPLCVGIDPVIERLPKAISSLPPLDAIRTFCNGVLEAVSSDAAVVKFQSACFERFGFQGMEQLGELKAYAKSLGLQIILDAKRGDIGISAEHYAVAATADGPCDWITVNPYLGVDTILPFLDAGLGVFCLVRTSNPSGDVIQSQQLEGGATVAESIGSLIHQAGSAYIGNRGWSALGAVVGATKPSDAIVLRACMPQQIFLMPGIGAQGGSVEDIGACFVDGYGALATASRSILYPTPKNDWQTDIANATNELATALRVGGPA